MAEHLEPVAEHLETLAERPGVVAEHPATLAEALTAVAQRPEKPHLWPAALLLGPMDNAQGLQVYKFGGASVKDAAAILNLCRIVRDYGPKGPLVIVVSAMGKTTNALEEIYDLAYNGRDYEAQLAALEAYHLRAATELYAQFARPEEVMVTQLPDYFQELRQKLQAINSTGNYDEGYDQIVSFGEAFSAYLVTWALGDMLPRDVLYFGGLVATDTTWREGRVDWAKTQE